MSITKPTLHDLSRQVQNSAARGRIKAILDAVIDACNGTLPAGFLSADTEGRAAMASSYFNEATATAKFAAGAITGALLKAGALSADVAGRALMATGYFTAAKALDAFAANSIAGTLLDGTLCGAPTSLSGAGAIPITAPACLLTTTGGAEALTVADGAYAGQKLDIIHVVDGGSGVITQTTGANLRADITSITFTNAGDFCRLVWTGALWTPTIYYGVTIATS